MTMPDHRYDRAFRAEETESLMACARSGYSALVVGVSGVGKSNFLRHLLDPEVQRQFLAEKAADTLFFLINVHDAPDTTSRALYSLILEQLEMSQEGQHKAALTREQLDQISHYHDLLLQAGDDALRVRRAFRQALHVLLQEPSRRLVLLLDQFDDIFWQADPRLFANLRGLREAYKYRLAFFVFMHNTLTSFSQDDSHRAEFYELLSSNMYGLKPYGEVDAQAMLRRLAGRRGEPLSPDISSRFIELSGGHASLLGALYQAHTRSPFLLTNLTPERALQELPVRLQCESIWNSLRLRELQVLAKRVGTNKAPGNNQAVLVDLKLKGILADDTAFSPIFAAYLSQRKSDLYKPISLDEKTHEVSIGGGDPIHLPEKEFPVFRALYHQQGEVVPKADLLQAGWAGDHYMTDGALTSALYRIRQRLKAAEEYRVEVENVGSGWRLTSTPIKS